ncbi:MAG: mechanosensitive ion channel family protein [Candidatus Rokuibacteriota bacterium]
MGSLLDQLALLLGRALTLGETASVALARLVTILGVLLLGWVAYRIVTALIHRVLRPLEGATDYPARIQRARTLGPLLSSSARYLVAFLVGMVVLQELGIDVRALIVSAGVVGLAIGLGAQSLIKDVLMGFFILFENLLAVGDVIEVGSHTGVVEAVGLRVTKIRKFSGELRIVPNGELTAFSHHTAGWARAIVEVGVPPDQEVTRALAVLELVGRAFQAAHAGTVLEPPAAEGIIRFGESALVLQLSARVDARQKGPLEHELRRRVKQTFDAEGIPISYPQLVVHVGSDRRSSPVTRNEKEPAV